MGGRGGASGLASASSQQKAKMNRLREVVGEGRNGYSYTSPKFSKNKDGSVSYSYDGKRIVTHEHGGKMSSPDKADIYERTEHYSGRIMPDGLRIKDKTTKSDVLIRKGRLPRRKQ